MSRDDISKTELTNVTRYVENAVDNARTGRVLIAAGWFAVDPYAAAVRGIMSSIHIAIGTGISGGMSQKEFDILIEVRGKLLELDPALKENGNADEVS